MQIGILLESQLRIAAGTSTVTLTLDEGATIESAVRLAAGPSGSALHAHLLDQAGSLQPSLLIFLNSEPVPRDRIGTVRLTEHDEVLLFPPLSGG
jgi:sulfur carrier protein ThiS